MLCRLLPAATCDENDFLRIQDGIAEHTASSTSAVVMKMSRYEESFRIHTDQKVVFDEQCKWHETGGDSIERLDESPDADSKFGSKDQKGIAEEQIRLGSDG